jgi:hypothetical protein
MSARIKPGLTAALVIVLLAATIAIAADQIFDESVILNVEHPAIDYFKAPVNDPVAKLDQQLAAGKVKLEYKNGPLGYLPSVLKNLGVNPDSQILVFSKTSFQAAKIGPRVPRALFFSDNVMVGSVQNGDVLEFAALDPRQGYVFYTMDLHESDQPRFVRRDVCLQCHQGPATLGIPGIMVGSVFPDAGGMPASRAGNPVTDHRTSFQERWGGWYVSGTNGGMTHRGNAVARDPRAPDVLESQGTQNLLSLAKKFDATNYMSGASDIVALMTLEHQTRMTNLITRLGWDERMGQHERMEAGVETMLTYMLFTDEAKLYDPIEGVSTFTKTFAERSPRDKQGRSLRDFDLKTRMFRYPLSYMVYSDAFDAMPDAVKARVYQRLYEVLSGKDENPKFARLTPTDRRAILEILRDTKPGLPAYFAE